MPAPAPTTTPTTLAILLLLGLIPPLDRRPRRLHRRRFTLLARSLGARRLGLNRLRLGSLLGLRRPLLTTVLSTASIIPIPPTPAPTTPAPITVPIVPVPAGAPFAFRPLADLAGLLHLHHARLFLFPLGVPARRLDGLPGRGFLRRLDRLGQLLRPKLFFLLALRLLTPLLVAPAIPPASPVAPAPIVPTPRARRIVRPRV